MKKQILIVDDDTNIRRLLKVNLEDASYSVIEAVNGDDALAAYQENKPDLIILDIMMPFIDGWEVAKIIRDNEYDGHHIPIIMLTARDTQRDRFIGTSVFNADAYMTKPFDIDELLRTIETLLYKSSPEQPGA